MREIKFRAWENEQKIMYKVDEVTLNTVLVHPYPEVHFNNRARLVIGRQAIVMQFSGLKDKNGKDIYEGDIMLEKNINYDACNCSVEESYSKRYYEVKFSPIKGFFLEGKSGYNREQNFEGNELAGSIYENPELLTK